MSGGGSGLTNSPAPKIAVEIGTVDAGGKLQAVSAADPLPVTGSITAVNPSVAPTGSAVPADATYVGFKGSTGNLTAIQLTAAGALPVDASGTIQPVSGTVAVSNFPATQPVSGTVAATQSGTWTVQPGNTANTTPWLVTGTGGTFPVSGTVAATQSGTWNITNVSGTVSLPTGASTSALQTTGNTSLASIDTKTPALGQAAMAASVPVVIASNQSAVPVTTTTTTTTAAFQAEGSIAFGSITGSFQTVLTPSASTKILQMRNNTNVSISVSFDAGTTTNYVLDSGDAVSLDLLANGLVMSTTAIQVRQTSGAPSSGSFRINAGH